MRTNRLDPRQVAQVSDLAARATAVDGVAPLNEEGGFALRDDSAQHLLHLDGEVLAGYLQWRPDYRTAQLVVDPGLRRRGIGSGLLAALNQRRFGIWAFGDLPAAGGFAEAHGLVASRGLLIMQRELDGTTAPHPPEGLTLRGYTDADAADFLAVNAAAFAAHPEQGALDAAGLAERVAEPWFDPAGLILAFDPDGLAGFHWTKRRDADTGEVYVLGVAPRAQGLGYGPVLLRAGLAYLQASGAKRVLLYVDSAEAVAVRMYERAGFRVVHRDVLYSPKHQGADDDLG